VCGEPRPDDAMVVVRNDKMPLLKGIVNFYPAFAYGMRVCGLCALAVRFLPFSVLRVGEERRLWFLHTQALPVASRISQEYGWAHLNNAISANEPLDFFGSWRTAGDAGTVLYLLCELLKRFHDQLREIYLHPLPTTAYLFSNHLQSSYVQPIPIPNELLRFFATLQAHSASALDRFQRELLEVPGGLSGKKRKERINFVRDVASRMLNMKPIIGACLDDDALKLRGGWLGHRLYLREVLGMPLERLAILERLGIAIAQSEDAKKLINELRSARGGELYGVLLSYVRRGWLKHDEFYTLLPPNDYGAAGEIRDILLAVIYEWQHCQERGEEFPALAERAELTPDETLARIQQIGERLLKRLSNFKRWLGRLQMARTTAELRGVYLTAVRHGALSFSDFVFLAPLGNRQTPWLLRDYLLAFLFEKVREELPELGVEAGVEEDEIAVIEPEQVEIEGGET
ncbi:MAG: type I-B CRISPR-associated protein Cas8b1/Cst1, partial [Thermoprotei archaeon]